MPGTKTSDKSWKTRSRSANKAQTLRELTEQARAISQRSASGPAPPDAARPEISTHANETYGVNPGLRRSSSKHYSTLPDPP